MVISLVNLKGGCGKSTLATNIAACFAARGSKVGLIDTDSQGTAFNWIARRSESEVDVPHIAFACLPKAEMLKRQSVDTIDVSDVTVIDGTPGSETTAITACTLALSDIVLVPLNPSISDLWAMLNTVEKIREATQYRDLKPYSVINRQVKNSKVLQEVMSYLNDEDVFSVLPLLETRISNYVAFAEVMSDGLGMVEAKKKNPQAAKEIEQLVDEILKRSGKK